MRFPSTLNLLGCTLLFASAATAGSTTTGSHPACGQPHWLEAALAYAEEGNTAGYERYINTGRCIETREGMDIEIIARYGDADHDRVEFEFRGFRFYTVAEAIAAEL